MFSFTRGRLRYLLKRVHFYSDKAAFLDLPSMDIDNEYNGCITVRGITINILDFGIQFRGTEASRYKLHCLAPTQWTMH